MKRLIAAGVLTVIIAVIHFSGTTYIKKVINQSNNLLADCVSEYESNLNPEEKAKKLQKYWSNQEDFLSIFAHHDNIDEIERAIDSLAVYSSTQNSEIFYEYSGAVKTLLHQLYEDNSFSMHSIL
jgi:predicted component of type VI protein secretion system